MLQQKTLLRVLYLLDKYPSLVNLYRISTSSLRCIRYALNENVQFWNQFLCMMDVYDLLRADRDGIWGLHLDAVLRSVYLCAAFDSSNYLRSIYHDLP